MSVPVRPTAVIFTVPLELLVNVTVCGVELVSTTVLGNTIGEGNAVALYAATVPDKPTDSAPAEVARLSPPVRVGVGADVGNGLSLTVMVQLLAAGRLAPQVVAEMKNSVGDALGAPSVTTAVSALVTVTVCGSDWVPCAVEAKVSEVGDTVTRGAVATPVSAHVYVTAGCDITGRNGADAEVMGPIVNVAVSVGVGTARMYVTTT